MRYYKCKGVQQDHTEAIKWFRLAAEQGNATAQCSLGAMHINGEGVPQDFVKAAQWTKLAAEQGDADAITGLGILLHEVLFPPGTNTRSRHWLASRRQRSTASEVWWWHAPEQQHLPSDGLQWKWGVEVGPKPSCTRAGGAPGIN
jgi:TPR repeat protein